MFDHFSAKNLLFVHYIFKSIANFATKLMFQHPESTVAKIVGCIILCYSDLELHHRTLDQTWILLTLQSFAGKGFPFRSFGSFGNRCNQLVSWVMNLKLAKGYTSKEFILHFLYLSFKFSICSEPFLERIFLSNPWYILKPP